MDMEIIRDLFDKLIRAGKLLNRDSSHYEDIFRKLKPVSLGTDGRVLEWGTELSEWEKGHRHISHLYGFYPADILTGPDWEAAAEKTLRWRMENGCGCHGWSNAWIANVYARLGDGAAVQRHIRTIYEQSIYPNLFDAHPPFQIDGNFGICAAICEALIQDHTGDIRLLPALPEEWASGSVRGFVTRTGQRISFRWEQGKLTESEITER
jgi:alpha-L-fucosidase 2